MQSNPNITRDGVNFKLRNPSISFAIPKPWLEWYEQNEQHKNIHVLADELRAIKEVKGDWDSDFTQILNGLMDFDRCHLQVGNDGFGEKSVSYHDLHMRLYVLDGGLQDVLSQIDSRSRSVLPSYDGSLDVGSNAGNWHRRTIAYFRVYDDYGGTATIDFWLRAVGPNEVIVLSFMYVDPTNREAMQGIIDSVQLERE